MAFLDKGVDLIKLYPACDEDMQREIYISLSHAKQSYPSWLSYRACLTIDGVPFSDAQPGEIFVGIRDFFTSILHFPIVAKHTHPVFGGRHTLLMKVVNPGE